MRYGSHDGSLGRPSRRCSVDRHQAFTSGERHQLLALRAALFFVSIRFFFTSEDLTTGSRLKLPEKKAIALK